MQKPDDEWKSQSTMILRLITSHAHSTFASPLLTKTIAVQITEAFLFKPITKCTLSHSYRIHPKAIVSPSANRCNVKIWDASAILIMRASPHELHPSTNKCGLVRTLQVPTAGQKAEITLLKKHTGLWAKDARNCYFSISQPRIACATSSVLYLKI